MDYQVLLYYNYTKIEEPEEFAKNHLAFCKSLDLKGRILVAEEGINGTVSGTVENTTAYMEAMKADPRFADTMFKIDPSEGHAFKKMFVRYRSELVSLKLEEDIDPNQVTGAYLSPQEFKEAILDEQTVVIDARNDYEYDLGHFRGAVRPDIRSFRELPDWIREHKEEFMEKRVVTYCTGGIRCEKFSGWLVREGFKDVGQLHGGIATYGKDPEVQGELWDGKMYVFDERIAVDINQVDKQIVGRDWFDGTPCERYINCSNPECNRQILASIENEEKHLGACSIECAKHPRNRYVQDHGISPEEAELRFTALIK
ncbi:TPA: rhodanese-related sulfurtransferase [Enterococcus faecium]|uniref:oxygen-dependent tRNA uridine(34) hydroxylase TrhO n=1 Tax=Enterococcus TaxID=1350 RepID=UPI000CF29700|nr:MULTISPECIES: rhodanese-related sulfurtransferase [Enterococcus]EGP4989734.1 rhodanese-related sulfurtransferase [Enterococcus faecium]EHG8745329.1 rhodanese-related sulfurtransferase [Enterococcus faecium]EME3439124.1 rhodanese-related sulfurtransferase [Enterococcus faecium]EMF0328980.1 rhodanese-related sulfurtransferase [Enterococcus faecium]MBD9897464.1 rhodanese-related sulfurtransferase [Enterococcus faecium]